MDFELRASQRYCNFCYLICEELTINRVTSVQARALSTVLSFEDKGSSVPKEEIEAKYLHATSCHACKEWVSEAESVVQEWEYILDKIRTICFRLKQIIRSGEKLYLQRSRKRKKEFQNIPESLVPLPAVFKSEQYDLGEHSTEERDVPQHLNVINGNDVDYLNQPEYDQTECRSHEDDPDLITDSDEESSIPTEAKVKTAVSPYRTSVRFTQVQKTVPFRQYDQQKDLIWDRQYDDLATKSQICNDVAATVAAVEVSSTPNSKGFRKAIQPMTLKESEEENYTYIQETTRGPIRLKYLKIELVRCEEPVSQPGHRYSRKRLYENSDDGTRMKRLRKKARRRRAGRATPATTKRRTGRPPKYGDPEGSNGPMEPCFVKGCKFSSSHPERLAGHYRQQHLKDPHGYKCSEPNCHRAFSEYRRLVIHRNAHKGKYFFICQQCGKEFLQSESLQKHMILKHTKTPPTHLCQVCNRSYYTEKLLNKHINESHNAKLFSCTVDGCTYSSKTAKSLKTHRNRLHPEEYPDLAKSIPKEREVCVECGMAFLSKHSFRRHQLVHQGVSVEVLKPHACSYDGCTYRTDTKNSLSYHVFIKHEATEKNFQCTFPNCTAKFKTTRNVKYHIKQVHEKTTKVKPLLPCKFCETKLCTSSALRNHIATQHTTGNQNDFVCNRCNRGFPTKKYLRRHELVYPNCEPVQIGKDAIQCEICNKYCSNLAGLKRHNHLVHNSELRPWECQKCGKTFPIKMYLMRHERESKSCVAQNIDDLSTCLEAGTN